MRNLDESVWIIYACVFRFMLWQVRSKVVQHKVPYLMLPNERLSPEMLLPETPLPKFDQSRGLGTNFGIMQMSKILHAARYSFRPIRSTNIRRPVLAFSAVDWDL